MTKRTSAALALIAALAAAGCSTVSEQGRSSDPTTAGPGSSGDIALIAELQPFDACDDMLAWLKAEALERVGPYGLPGSGWYGGPMILQDDMVRSEVASADQALPTTATAGDASNKSAGTDYSVTNTVEAGVDEPDLVKTDGERIVTLAQGELRVIDPNGGQPVELGSVALDQAWGGQLLLAGDRALVLASTNLRWADGALEPVDPSGADYREGDIYVPAATLTEIDLADPAKPTIVRTLSVEGNLVNSRMVGTTARIVVQSAPSKFDFLYPSGPGSEDRARDINREVIEESTVDQWLPGYVLDDGSDTETGRLVDCEAVSHPASFSGFSTLSVLTVDLAAGLTPGSGVAVIADGQRVYASPENLYVAVDRYIEADGEGPDAKIAPPDFAPGEYETAIHKFSIAGTAPATYVASGTVRGHLMNDFSMSEHDDHLRVATTDGPPWGGPMPVEPAVVETDEGTVSSDDQAPSEPEALDVSESFVTVLATRDGELAQVGQVGGLGKGERIQAVRFLGDVGYVVTFRQVDPLYAIDLSEPTQPTVRGELKIEGYSAYLHPLGDGRLLGIGVDATSEGRRTGAQASIFDVSDLDNPTRVGQYTLPDAFSNAEYDYKAFLYWAPTGHVVVPVQVFDWDDRTGQPGPDNFTGALVLRVDGDNLDEAGRLSHPSVDPGCGGPVPVPTDGQQGEDTAEPGSATTGGVDQVEPYCPAYQPYIQRSLVIDGSLYTLSDTGLAADGLADLARTGWLQFGVR
ncbi:MAG: beta-propeller domain-containing protein [Acidimicrobiia bacterium]|nr:beta-propeller domain-containing protein [Acidimicrobiia bacterium]